jgi:putative hemolysin
MQKLWQGIAEYLSNHNIDLMFGCASFQETNPEMIADQLAYLHHFHLPPDNLCAVARPDCTASIKLKPKEELDARRVFSDLPPLIKGYLRLGAYIGKGAYLDKEMNCIDVCIVLPTHKVTAKYIKHFERKIQKDVVRDSDFSKNF